SPKSDVESSPAALATSRNHPLPIDSELRSDYDVWHQRHHDADPGHDDATSPWYLLVSEYLGSVAGLRVLEVACGRGGFLRQLAHAGAQVTGCDFSSAALRSAATKLPAPATSLAFPPALIQGDAQSLPFASGSFDLIVSCETIEHLPRLDAALRELHR